MTLLERDDDLARLAALLPAQGRAGALVLLAGEAGVGKTAFLKAFAGSLSGRIEVLWGNCDPLGTPEPLAPVLDFAPTFLGSGASGLASGGGQASVLAGGGSGIEATGRDGLFRDMLQRLRREPARLVVVEDLQWADEATLDLLRFLGRRVEATRALVVCSYRDDIVGPDHPLRLLLGQLATAASVHRLRLAPLSLGAVRALSAGSGLDAAELFRRTGGNPFYVTEVVAATRRKATIGAARSTPSHGVASVGAEVPATVRDAVLARVAGLGPGARGVLDAAAVLGAPAEPWLLETLLGEVEADIDACAAAGMLVHAGNCLGFRHELARDAVLESMAPERRRRLHAAVLAALEGARDRGVSASRLAYHAEHAHDARAVLAYAPKAGREAARMGAHREAAQQYSRALRFAGAARDADRAELLEAFAQAHRVVAYTQEALEAEEEAARIWRTLGDARAEGAALARLAGLYAHRGRTDDAERSSRRALELLGGLAPTLELGHAQVVQATLRVRARDNAEAVAWGERALATAERFGDRELSVRAHCRVAAGLLLQGAVGAEAHLADARRIAQEDGLRRVMALPYLTSASVAVECYRFGEARQTLEEGLATCREYDLDSNALYLRSLLALTDLQTGNWRAATAVADDIVRQTEVEALTRVMALLALGRLRARHGDSGADEVLLEALELAEPTRSLQRLGPVRAARAEAAWLAGDPDRAHREAEAAYGLALERRHVWLTGELGYWLTRVGAELQLPDWAAEPFRLEASGDHEAAAQAWRTCGCPYEEARALAESGTEQGLRAALEIFGGLGAHPATAETSRLLRERGVRAIPRGPRPATRANPAGLTPRESEVLRLLATGMTNRAIAASLHISARTAAHHVSSILAKLAVRRRAEAVALAHELGLAEPDAAVQDGAQSRQDEPST